MGINKNTQKQTQIFGGCFRQEKNDMCWRTRFVPHPNLLGHQSLLYFLPINYIFQLLCHKASGAFTKYVARVLYFFSLKVLFNLILQLWHFVILRHSATILVTGFTYTNNLTYYFLIFNSLIINQSLVKR